MNNDLFIDDFDIDLHFEEDGVGSNAYGISWITTVTTVTPFTGGGNDSSSVACATLSNQTE